MGDGRFSNLEFGGDTPDDDREPQRFVTRDRDSAYFLDQGRTREIAGDHEAALRHFSAALGEDPLLVEAWLGQLRMLLAMGELPEARLWADKALERFPDNPRVLAAKAVALHRMGSRIEARTLCDLAMKADGEDAFIWLSRGEIIYPESSGVGRRCYDRTLALAGEDLNLSIEVGARLLDHQQYTEAISVLQDVCTRAPRAARAFFVLGCAQRETGMPSHARTNFETALALEPQLEAYRRAAADAGTSGGGLLGGLWRRMTRT